MNWKTAILTVLLAVVLAIVGTWLYRDSVWKSRIAAAPSQRDTITTVVSVSLPPPVVTPNPAPAVIDTPQTDWRLVDSLCSVVNDKDAMIRTLLLTRTAEQAWESHTDSASIVGRVMVTYSPAELRFRSRILVDSLVVPARVIEVMRYITTTESDWSLIAIVAGFGLALGFVGGISI